MPSNAQKPNYSQSISAKSPHQRKTEADRIPRITIQDLKKKKLLQDGGHGYVSWEDPYVGIRYSFVVTTTVTDEENEEAHVEFGLPHRSTEKQPYASATLVTTEGTLGGKRYWFKCTQKKCRKQVSTLYLKEGIMAYRNCHTLTYKSKNLSGSAKKLGRVRPLGELERLGKAIKRFEYAGRPTKRYQSYIKKRDRSMKAMNGMFDRFTGSVQKTSEKFK